MFHRDHCVSKLKISVYVIAFCFSFSNEEELLEQCSVFILCLAVEASLAITYTWKPIVDCMTKALIWVYNLYN